MRKYGLKTAAPRRAAGPNRLEERYVREVLGPAKLAGEIREWRYEGITLRLAKRTSYTPDYLVVRADGSVELHEVKGFMRDDAAVKLKWAAKEFPFFRFILARRDKAGWHAREILA